MGQVSLRGESGKAPEPRGKLDAMTGYSFTTPVWQGGQWVVPAVTVAEVRAARIANGPEDADLGWNAVDWRRPRTRYGG